MTYPTIVLTVAGGACIFMLMFVIPVFAKMFCDFGGELPAPTRIVMNAVGLPARLLVGPGRRLGG